MDVGQSVTFIDPSDGEILDGWIVEIFGPTEVMIQFTETKFVRCINFLDFVKREGPHFAGYKHTSENIWMNRDELATELIRRLRVIYLQIVYEDGMAAPLPKIEALIKEWDGRNENQSA